MARARQLGPDQGIQVFGSPLGSQTPCQHLVVIVWYWLQLGSAGACQRRAFALLQQKREGLAFFQLFYTCEDEFQRLIVFIAVNDNDLFVLPLKRPLVIFSDGLAALSSHWQRVEWYEKCVIRQLRSHRSQRTGEHARQRAAGPA